MPAIKEADDSDERSHGCIDQTVAGELAVAIIRGEPVYTKALDSAPEAMAEILAVPGMVEPQGPWKTWKGPLTARTHEEARPITGGLVARVVPHGERRRPAVRHEQGGGSCRHWPRHLMLRPDSFAA
jgi:hypothetical protein